MPYRRSIWKLNEEYAPPSEDADDADLQFIARIQSIEAAKKRTPPIPMARLPELAEKLKNPPDVGSVNAEEFAAYLKQLCVYGVGIKTAVCLLAVTSRGTFPPMDEKLAKGLVELEIIREDCAKGLNSTRVDKFTTAYLEVVLLWREARDKGECPEDIDIRWAKGRNEA